MKITFTLVGLFALTLHASAQMKNRHAIKVNPLSAIVKTVNVSLEKAVSPNKTVQLGTYYSRIELDDVQYAGYGLTPEYRIYFGGAKQALHGGYVAPFARYQHFSLSEKGSGSAASFQTIGGGAVLGYQKLSESGFVIDVFAGPSFADVHFKSGSPADFDLKNAFKGFGVRLGASIGFTF